MKFMRAVEANNSIIPCDLAAADAALCRLIRYYFPHIFDDLRTQRLLAYLGFTSHLHDELIQVVIVLLCFYHLRNEGWLLFSLLR